MRIRRFKQEDMPTLVQIEQVAAQADGRKSKSEEEFAGELTSPGLDATSNTFVITDDDDELNTWSQAGTLDGIEGEIVGYTIVQLHQDEHAYHLLCQGAVYPQFRRQNAGRALLICALNYARLVAAEFEFEAEEAGLAVYFEALLPVHDPASARVAGKCEMQAANEAVEEGMCLYRREL